MNEENLINFGFASRTKPEVSISQENYLPIFKKFQSAVELSATD